MPVPRHRLSQRGFALIVVLNIVVILSGIAIVAAQGSREGAAISAHFRAEAEQRSLAEGAMALAASNLLATEPERHWFADNRPYRVALFGREAVIQVQDESGKLGLNSIDEVTLGRAIANSGIPASQAKNLAAAILDWRDPDNDRRLGGAERPDYAAAGFPDSPANGPFLRNVELYGVLGVTDDVYRRISGIVSPYARASSVNLNVAPPAVLNALFGPGSPEIAAILGRRSVTASSLAGGFGEMTGVSRSDGLSRQTGSAEAVTYSITVALYEGRTVRSFEGAFKFQQDSSGYRLAVVAAMAPREPDDAH